MHNAVSAKYMSLNDFWEQKWHMSFTFSQDYFWEVSPLIVKKVIFQICGIMDGQND